MREDGTIRIAIVEDEEICRRQMKEYLERYGKEKGYEFELSFFTNGDGITDPYRGGYDMILMDIIMPLVNGFEAAQMIRKADPEVVIIFITNSMQYAVKGYSVEALDYVLKPIAYYPFTQYIDRAIARMKKRSSSFIMVRGKDGIRKLDVMGIRYIESQGHQLVFHIAGEEAAAVGKIKEMEEKLERYGFFRCHSGYLIHLKYVEGFADNSVVIEGESIPVSRARKKELLEAMADYISGARK